MKDIVTELPGMARVRARFIEMLVDRHDKVATFAIGAWDGKTVKEINGNLSSAQAVLHQIAGTAGSLGFAELGTKAHLCENEIIAHLRGPDAKQANCPADLIHSLDAFLRDCQAILNSPA